MTNKEIAKSFQLLGSLMELHGENPFKIRSYQNAYRTLRSLDQPLAEMEEAEIAAIKGVGKAISGKIRELVENGQMQTLEKYKAQTPDGIQEMLPHAPVTQSVLEEGVIDLVADDGPLADDPDFEESYWQWREPFDRGEAGVFTVPLTEILDIVEQAIRSSAN